MNRQQLELLVEQVYSKLEGNTRLYPREEVERAIYDALVSINLAYAPFKSAANQEISPGEFAFPMPPMALKPLELKLGDEPLGRVRFRAFVHTVDRLPSPGKPQVWCQISNWIAVWPEPATTFRITVIYLPTGAYLWEDPEVFIPETYLGQIVDLAWVSLVMKEGGLQLQTATEGYDRFIRRLQYKTADLSWYIRQRMIAKRSSEVAPE